MWLQASTFNTMMCGLMSTTLWKSGKTGIFLLPCISWTKMTWKVPLNQGSHFWFFSCPLQILRSHNCYLAAWDSWFFNRRGAMLLLCWPWQNSPASVAPFFSSGTCLLCQKSWHFNEMLQRAQDAHLAPQQFWHLQGCSANFCLLLHKKVWGHVTKHSQHTTSERICPEDTVHPSNFARWLLMHCTACTQVMTKLWTDSWVAHHLASMVNRQHNWDNCDDALSSSSSSPQSAWCYLLGRKSDPCCSLCADIRLRCPLFVLTLAAGGKWQKCLGFHVVSQDPQHLCSSLSNLWHYQMVSKKQPMQQKQCSLLRCGQAWVPSSLCCHAWGVSQTGAPIGCKFFFQWIPPSACIVSTACEMSEATLKSHLLCFKNWLCF